PVMSPLGLRLLLPLLIVIYGVSLTIDQNYERVLMPPYSIISVFAAGMIALIEDPIVNTLVFQIFMIAAAGCIVLFYAVLPFPIQHWWNNLSARVVSICFAALFLIWYFSICDLWVHLLLCFVLVAYAGIIFGFERSENIKYRSLPNEGVRRSVVNGMVVMCCF